MPTTTPTYRGSNLKRIKCLEHESANLRTLLWWLVGGGEFAAWAQTKAMPMAARIEFEEARALFPEGSFDDTPPK